MKSGETDLLGDESAPTAARSGATRLLPAGLVGRGRRPSWQRTRLRRVVAAALVASASWLALSAFLPQSVPRGVPIVIITKDFQPGHVLTAGDLAIADWPKDLRPVGAVTDPVGLVGKALGAGMSRGEAVTPARIRGTGLLTGALPGIVAAHVRLADPAMAAMTAPGDRVDLISSLGKVVAEDVAVLAVDADSSGGGWSASAATGQPSGVIVAVARDAALRLATADPSGRSDVAFSLVMRAPSS
jgi:Flp pilus assembly protein CpaB